MKQGKICLGKEEMLSLQLAEVDGLAMDMGNDYKNLATFLRHKVTLFLLHLLKKLASFG